MADSLKAIMQDVVDAPAVCPEEFKGLAFEILLRHRLEHGNGTTSSVRDPDTSPPPRVSESKVEEQVRPPEVEEEIALKDLHAKVRKFLQDHSLDVSHVNALYYKDGGRITPLYDDLRSTAMAESQVRLGLLGGLRSLYDQRDLRV